MPWLLVVALLMSCAGSGGTRCPQRATNTSGSPSTIQCGPQR